jgi:hypothetical protein
VGPEVPDVTWDVRTNIKAKPGSQGTLFQGGSDQMTEAKWPRGYTPERLNAVHDEIGPGRPARTATGTVVPVREERRKLIDTVARSTVPLAHLQRVQFHPGVLHAEGRAGERLGKNTAGVYHPKRIRGTEYGSEVEPAEIQIIRGESETSTAIHEIGHHVSARDRTWHSAYDTTQKRGTEEAFADNYAQEHYRPRKGEKYRGVGMYNGGDTDHIRTAQFFDAYHKHRDYQPIFGRQYHDPPSKPPPPPGTPPRNPTLPGLEPYGKKPWL